MTVTEDHARAFVAAVSMFAALEGAAGPAGFSAVLPFLGIARAELCDHGQRATPHLLDIRVPSFIDAAHELDDLLTSMLGHGEDDECAHPLACLSRTLRVHHAREILRRGLALALSAECLLDRCPIRDG